MLQIENIKQLAASYGLTVNTRIENHDAWMDTLSRCSYLPVMYTNSSIDFQLAYQRGHGGDWNDLSLIIYWDNKSVAVWPFSLAKKDGNSILNSHGLAMLPPLFSANCPISCRKRINKSCLDLSNAIATIEGIRSWESGESFNDTNGLSDWHTESMTRHATCIICHELFLDLRPDMVEIKRNFRKSYKSLITSGLELWYIGVLDKVDELIWDEFRQLHLKVSGRKTRSDETWAIHLRDIGSQQAFLVYLRNKSGVMVGGGFFNFTRDEGLYAVAAYDRTMFDKPLGHVVQYRAIEELKKRGVRWYKIGPRPYPAETPTPTDKEISIGEFKQGFASHIFPRFVLLHTADESSKRFREGKPD